MVKSKGFLLGGMMLFLVLILASCNLRACNGSSLPGQATESSGAGGTVGVPSGPANTDGAETIFIPGGTFWMGSDSTDSEADTDEFPRHPVTLDGFYIYTHEVTNEMYARCVAAGGCMPVQMFESGPTSHYDDPAYANHPVVGVDWLMARDYCVWAGGRLPTEAEWELAARGLESLRYPWGSEEPACDRVNMLGCRAPADTVQVGSYALGNSPYDVWDMAGNVWEWVNDWYDEDYYVFSPANNPLGPYYGELKTVRGGGLYSEPVQMRTAARVGANPHRAYEDVGFRCVALGEALPSGYAFPPGYHEFVPPGEPDDGGEPLEVPDWPDLGRVGPVLVSCPDPAGLIHLFIGAVGPGDAPITAFDVTVNGAAFDCYYDDPLRGLQCSGPAPLDYDTLTVYDVGVHLVAGGLPIFTLLHPTVPHDCPVGAWPPDIRGEASCPSETDGTVSVTFVSAPPIRWERVQYLSGMLYLDAACTQTSPSTLVCTLPARDVGEVYSFNLEGQDDSGVRYVWWTVVAVPTDCPEIMIEIPVEVGCWDSMPVAGIFTPPGNPLAAASVAGVPLACMSIRPDLHVCNLPPAAPGSEVRLDICLSDGLCTDRLVSMPACSGESGPMFSLYAGCSLSGEPSVKLDYWPCDSALASAQASGTPLTCTNLGACLYLCTGLPGDPGTVLTFDAYLEDGSEIHGTTDVVSCGAPPGEETSWRIIDAGCHDETRIYVLVDTDLPWLVPGAAYTYGAGPATIPYSCSVHSTIPGRLYCIGARPGAPEDFYLCLRPDGGDLRCQYLSDFPAWVASVPSCGTEPPPEIPPPFDCSVFATDPASCNAHPECHWDFTVPPNGTCVHD
ncbi:MAG: formylglycine-generating enzyme family protein [Anaerolineales bacterium]